MTSVKDQNPAATCWAFATVGSIEAQINLNYNQHLDKDLSEQIYVDCINSSTPIWGMNPYIYPECSGDNLCYPGYQLCVPSLHGIADEACDPYAARDDSSSYCDPNHICSDWQNRIWRFNDFWDFKFTNPWGTPMCTNQNLNTTEEEFKRVLIRQGPMSSAYIPWNHAMVLAGYETDNTDGQTVWIYKNSWGANWGCTDPPPPPPNDCGYIKMKLRNLDEMGWVSLPIGPFFPPS